MAKKPTILLVDDDPDIREFVTFNLAKEGYNVVTAKDGAEGVEAVKKHRPDLVLLDVMMPGMDGIEACEAIRTNPDIASTLIAFLSARGEDYSQVAGFDAGADDYLVKPFAVDELLARVRALLRRNETTAGAAILTFDNLVLDVNRREVRRGDRVVELTKTEFDLLHILLEQQGIVLTREYLYEHIWGMSFETNSKSLDVYIGYLRRKIELDGESKLLHTVRGVGYVVKQS